MTWVPNTNILNQQTFTEAVLWCSKPFLPAADIFDRPHPRKNKNNKGLTFLCCTWKTIPRATLNWQAIYSAATSFGNMQRVWNKYKSWERPGDCWIFSPACEFYCKEKCWTQITEHWHWGLRTPSTRTHSCTPSLGPTGRFRNHQQLHDAGASTEGTKT